MRDAGFPPLRFHNAPHLSYNRPCSGATDMASYSIGRYQIRAELGRGGMATVYHALDPRFEREVAIKVLPREFLHDPRFRARFEREARAIAALQHPAIVPVHDFGEQDGQPYLVMRYMPGGSLADRIQRGPLSLSEAARILSHLAPALDAAHRRGLIHRDLKPGNILFDEYDNPYLSDFGIVKIVEESAHLTGTGGLVGTPAYMSPEQAGGGREVDYRSDLVRAGRHRLRDAGRADPLPRRDAHPAGRQAPDRTHPRHAPLPLRPAAGVQSVHPAGAGERACAAFRIGNRTGGGPASHLVRGGSETRPRRPRHPAHRIHPGRTGPAPRPDDGLCTSARPGGRRAARPAPPQARPQPVMDRSRGVRPCRRGIVRAGPVGACY